jgi:hypothetical protein
LPWWNMAMGGPPLSRGACYAPGAVMR